MGSPSVTLRVVLDTNVVLSALLFSRGRLTWIRHAWGRRQFIPLTCRATSEELIGVLSYPKFGLTADEISAILADYLPFTETVAITAAKGTPRTPDPDDQVFLDLAVAGKVRFLVTGDAALLRTPEPKGVRIVSPDVFRDALPD